MRILILTNNIGGLISFRKEVVEALIRDGNNVYISAPASEKSPELTLIGAEIIETPINRRGTNPISDLSLLVAYIKLIRSIRPNVVLTYTVKPNIYGGLACRFHKTVQVANITGLGTALESGNGMLTKFLILLYRIGLSKAFTVFSQNEGNQKFCLERGIVKFKNSQLLPGSGVNLDHFKCIEYPEDKTIRFLYIGRLMKDKGIDELLYVAKNISENRNCVEFHIIGSYEDDYAEIVNRYSSKGYICYHGEQKDVRPFIKKCSCVIHPSYHEGMSNVILEACASGRPVITTDICGCREAVNNGVSGLLSKPRDAESLLESVKLFMDLTPENRKQMGIEARRIMEEKFNRKIVIAAYRKAIYNSLDNQL